MLVGVPKRSKYAGRRAGQPRQRHDAARDQVAVGQIAEAQHAVDAFAHEIDPALAFAHRQLDVRILREE